VTFAIEFSISAQKKEKEKKKIRDDVVTLFLLNILR
jgi:hypothetical protein